jgi:hypothetical protein
MQLRFRLRTMIVGIALVCLALGALSGALVERRRAYYRSRVENFAWGEADVVERIARELRTARVLDARNPPQQAEAAAARLRAERLAELAAWHVKLERLYAWAAEHPLSELPPLPPPPASASVSTRNR